MYIIMYYLLFNTFMVSHNRTIIYMALILRLVVGCEQTSMVSFYLYIFKMYLYIDLFVMVLKSWLHCN